MVRGPLRRSTYSSPIAALPHRLFAISFSVRTFFTLYCMRICR
jgi:hypothetical protein